MIVSKQQEQLIIENLRIPIKSFRIFALEEIIRSGGSPEILSILKQIQAIEDDQDCSILISNAIEVISSRLNSSNSVNSIGISDRSDLLGKWKDADDNLRMHIIANLPAVLPKEFCLLGPELVEGSSPIVAARVIRIFGRNWPEDKYNIITNYLHSDNLVLKLASLRTLVHSKPDLLLNDLPKLLASSDPEIKVLAIRGLVKIDKVEALNHLQALLLSPTKTERFAGIQNCPFFPFDIIKPLLLKYFAAETNSELLTKAGWIIEMNPDVEVPFALFEIAERSPANKAELVKRVLNNSVERLKESGILGDKFPIYIQKLQNWVVKRSALRFVRQIIARLGEKSVAPEIEQQIVISIKQPILKETFIEAINWPVSNLVKSRIAKYLVINSPEIKSSQETKAEVKKEEQEKVEVKKEEQEKAEVKKEEQKKADASVIKYQDYSLLEMLASITSEKAKEKFDEIFLLLTNKNTNNELKIAVFQCLTRCKLRGAEDIATRLINNSDIALATSAVEYLGIVDPDSIFPYLGQCLNVPDMRMKSAAFGILKNYDYNQAISSLRAMLYSTDSNQQNMALECISQFDFTLVREMLTEFLCLTLPEPILKAGLCHFAANPSSDNIYFLYKIERSHIGKIAKQARNLREACPKATEEMVDLLDEEENGNDIFKEIKDKNSTKNYNEAELKERLRIEKEKKSSKKPAYAYNSSDEVPEKLSNQQLSTKSDLYSFVQSNKVLIAVIAFFVIALFVYCFFPSTPKVKEEKPKNEAITSEPLEIEGKVIKVEKGVVSVKATNGNIYILVPLQEGWKIPEKDKLIRGLVVPYKKNSNGEISARFGDSGYEYINSYTKENSGVK